MLRLRLAHAQHAGNVKGLAKQPAAADLKL